MVLATKRAMAMGIRAIVRKRGMVRVARAMATVTRVASNADDNKEGNGNGNKGNGQEEGYCKGSKSNGNGNEGGNER
jgi:hypothetical protein